MSNCIAGWVNRSVDYLTGRHRDLALHIIEKSYREGMLANGKEAIFSTAVAAFVMPATLLLAIGNIASAALLNVMALLVSLGSADKADYLDTKASVNLKDSKDNIIVIIKLIASSILNIVGTIIPPVPKHIQRAMYL